MTRAEITKRLIDHAQGLREISEELEPMGDSAASKRAAVLSCSVADMVVEQAQLMHDNAREDASDAG